MTPDSNVFRFDDSGIRNLLKAMESEHFVRIGIFGGAHKEAVANKNGKGRHAGKQPSGMTNAEVGFLCEVGRPKTEHSPRVPARSWLRVPLTNRINDIVKDTKVAFEKQAETGDSVAFYKKLGAMAEKAIEEAFDQGGPGWEPNAPATIAIKRSASPNIDTGQLRRAVASKVM
jgi:hypothetical protein